MKTLRRILTGSALLAAACSLASANSITGTCTTASGPTELGLVSVTGNTDGTVSCSKFTLNPSYLTEIDINITGGIIAPTVLTITNLDNAVHTGHVSQTVGFNVDASTPLAGFVLPSSGSLGDMIDDTVNSGTLSLAANPSGTVGGAPSGAIGTFSPTGSSSTGTLINTTSFGQYEGSGNWSFVVDTSTYLATGIFAGGHVDISENVFANATVSVTYDYTIPSGVPEPATYGLLGSALVGLGLLRKRLTNK